MLRKSVYVAGFLLLMTASLHSALSAGYSLSLAKEDVFRYRRPAVVIPRIVKAPTVDGGLSPREWSGAEAVSLAIVGGTDEPAATATVVWLAADDRNLYVAYRCSLYKGQAPVASTIKRDGSIGTDDVVTISIQPDPSQPMAYMFGCRCNGALYDRSMQVQSDDHVRNAVNWNAEWIGKAGREPGAWTAEMAIPISVLGLRPHGTVPVKLNLVRYWTPRGEKQRQMLIWATVRGDYIHRDLDRPVDFGVGLCTFGLTKGKPVSLAGIRRWDGIHLLNSEASGHVVYTNEKGVVRAGVSLPPQALQASDVRLQAVVYPVLVGERLGKPVWQTKLKLASPSPMKLVAEDLKAGDYRVRLTATGPRLSETREHSIAVRARPAVQEPVGRVVFEDSDWRQPGTVAWSAGVEHKATPELLLLTEPKTPVFAFDPTEDDTITCMVDFRDRLYVGSCTQPAATDTGSIFSYDPQTDVWEKSFQVKDQGLATMLATKEHIYVPGYDADDGDWSLGNFYVFDGKDWVEKRTVPRAIHIYGICVYHDRICLSADILEPPPAGMSVQAAADSGKIGCHGTVVSSGDGGETWREEFTGEQRGQDVGYMTVYDDKILLNAQGDLFTYDGSNWTQLSLGLPVLFVYDYDQVGDRLVLSTQLGAFELSGDKLRRMWWSYGHTRGMAKLEDTWFTAGYIVPGAYARHGPGGINCPDLKDKNSPRFYSHMTAVPEALLFDRPDASNPNFWRKIKWLSCNEMCTAIHSFKGRVYIGTHPDGRVLVMPVCKSGTLISGPKKMEAGNYRLWWDAATPPLTSVELQVRTGETPADLAKHTFVGPDSTTKSHFLSPGTDLGSDQPCYLQYRIVLKTNDPARTPYIKRVVLTENDTNPVAR